MSSLKSRWSEREARGLRGPELCAYASRLIGVETSLVLWGGGNSSIKAMGEDHARRPAEVLWIKASGYDMKSITAKGFSPLKLDDLRLARRRGAMTDDEMNRYLAQCALEPGSARPSIETLLHAWIPAAHVYHTHADAVAGLGCVPGSSEVTRKVFGDSVLWLPYIRPGFTLAKQVAEAMERYPRAQGFILDKHGALSWGDDARSAYESMREMANKAMDYQLSRGRRKGGRSFTSLQIARSEAPTPAKRRALALRLMPWIRGECGRAKPVIVRWTDQADVLRFLGRPDAKRLTQRGPFTPDHSLKTKARPLFWSPGSRASLAGAMERYRRWYAAYAKRHVPKGDPQPDPSPRVILVPGVGMFTTGADSNEAAIPQEIYLHTIQVISRISAFTRYAPLDLGRLGGIEFWELELYKERRRPPDKEFARRVMLVTGAAGAIGAETAAAFLAQGASVVLGDIDYAKALALEKRLSERFPGACKAVFLDVGSEDSVAKAFEAAVLAYGGLDILFSNAGIAGSAPVESLSRKEWERNFRVNATGHFLCGRQALRLLKAQGLGGAIVFNASKNVLAPGAGFAAYSASKAAQTQLARVMAMEGASAGVRVNIVNPDAVFEGSGLWSDAVRRQRALSHGVAVDKLEDFYASRNLLKARVTARDVAEAVLFLASPRSAKTTGAILPVDGGLREAFPR